MYHYQSGLYARDGARAVEMRASYWLTKSISLLFCCFFNLSMILCTMSYNIEKLRQTAVDPSKEVIEQDTFMRENKEWLKKSAKIALCVKRGLRVKGITQRELASRMDVSPQYVGRILKGQENLTLAVIAKIEKALQVTIFSIGIKEPVEADVSEDVID